MGLEGGLGIGLLASTFDVESVVFLRLGSHFLCGGVEESNAKIFENRIGSWKLLPKRNIITFRSKCVFSAARNS